MKAYERSVVCAVVAVALTSWAREPAPTVLVTMDEARELGPIKAMNAVNNGPSVANPGGEHKRGNNEEYAALRIPYARTHDSIAVVGLREHCCDVSAVFPDFEADENDPENYDFVYTDHYLDAIRRAGTEIFYRLGETTEHGPKKYTAMPPKDPAKWARICEHIVRHYNEGWGWGTDKSPATVNVAWSNQFNIVYWEIWNEADLDISHAGVPPNPRSWGGTVTNFYEFFSTAVSHLKRTFPKLKVGGPAIAYRQDWAEGLLRYCKAQSVPLDFFSWHTYSTNPHLTSELSRQFRGLLDKTGYPRVESIISEWNFVKGWTDDWVYSVECESAREQHKGAAYIAAAMVEGQHSPTDMMMLYDVRLRTPMNSVFDLYTYRPKKAYYAFYAWSKLRELGTEVASAVAEPAEDGHFYTVAAKGKDGKGAVLVVRYAEDNNITERAHVKVRLPKRTLDEVRIHLTDVECSHTEVGVPPRSSEGDIAIKMLPNSVLLVEYR